jgi:hypothetical protein
MSVGDALELLDAVEYGRDGELDEVSALDRLWFRDHPDTDVYHRKPHPVEVRQSQAIGRTVTRVRVERLPWGRVRHFIAVNGNQERNAA